VLTSNPPPAKPFGHYHLLRRIGAGGMGEVFLSRAASASGAPQVCVVKKMLPHLANDPGFVARFLDEAKVVVHLRHPGIARVLEMGEEEGEYFIAMEYVLGQTLAKISARLREQGARFPLSLALRVAQKMCDALAYAHQACDPGGQPLHVVHRDISPSNALVSYSGRVKIIDFGAAQSALKEARTAPRVVIGNLAYMSPEQARKKPVDGRADVYSMGVLLWELAVGRLPSLGADPEERWRRAANPRFVPPSQMQPSVPPEVDQIIMHALNPDPAKRWPSASAMKDALDAALASMDPTPSEAPLASLMASLFAREAEQDRATVAEALADLGEGAGAAAAPTEGDEVLTAAIEPTLLSPRTRSRQEAADPTRSAPRSREPSPPSDEPTAPRRATSPAMQRWRPLAQSALLFAAAFGLGALIAALVFRALHPT
jgi:serine/threonine protein kinase